MVLTWRGLIRSCRLNSELQNSDDVEQVSLNELVK
jgi:hypothetical protein